MKTPNLNKALRNAPEWACLKVTMDADGKHPHEDYKTTANEVRGMLKRFDSLAKGRLVVKCVDLCGGGNRSFVIFDGIPA